MHPFRRLVHIKLQRGQEAVHQAEAEAETAFTRLCLISIQRPNLIRVEALVACTATVAAVQDLRDKPRE